MRNLELEIRDWPLESEDSQNGLKGKSEYFKLRRADWEFRGGKEPLRKKG
jgi:hypothetical protein